MLRGYGYGYGYGWGLFYTQGFVLESMTAVLPPAGTRNGARIQSEINSTLMSKATPQFVRVFRHMREQPVTATLHMQMEL